MAEAKEEEEIEEFVAVEDEPQGEIQEAEDEIPEEKPTEGADDEDSDEDEDEETRLGADEPEAEEGKRTLQERRRQERKTRRKRQKERDERIQREMAFLSSRNEQLERRFSEVEGRQSQSEVSQIDQRIAYVKAQINQADQVIAAAIEQQRGGDMVEAQSIRDELRDSLRDLTNAKQTVGEAWQEQANPQGQTSPQLMTYATNFMQNHPWWKLGGRDEDSLIVSAIDSALAQEAYNPETQEYWDELSRRVQARLPHRFEQGDTGGAATGESGQSEKRRSKGPTFRSGGQERSLKPNEVYINPERKDAMIQAGVWEDPELRQKYLKQYADYDRNQRSND